MADVIQHNTDPLISLQIEMADVPILMRNGDIPYAVLYIDRTTAILFVF